MKIGIDCGHNIPKVDIGAKGVGKTEDVMNFEVTEELLKLLKTNPRYTVVECKPSHAVSVNDSLYRRVQLANANHCDLYVSVHHNATVSKKAHGTEVYHYVATSEKTKSLARNVCNKVANSCGFVNRGIKGANFYVLKYTNMPAILIEGCFADNLRDATLWKPDKIAKAIYEALEEYR